jgi:hypothetical protein
MDNDPAKVAVAGAGARIIERYSNVPLAATWMRWQL